MISAIWKIRAVRAALLAIAALGCASNPSVARHSETAGMRDSAAAAQFAVQLDSLRRAEGIPGLAAVVLRDTTVLLARGYGLADVSQGVLVTPETPFNIASVSKPLSAIVALRLAEWNALDLDQAMRRYPRLPGVLPSSPYGGWHLFRRLRM